MNRKTSALDALAPHEKAAVLEHLLTAQPELREPAEAFAVSLISDEDRSAVAGDVKDALSRGRGSPRSRSAGGSRRQLPTHRSMIEFIRGAC